MKCTECNAEIKPVVAIDIDGTLADYHGHFVRFTEDYLGRAHMEPGWWSYKGEGTFKQWWCDFYGADERTWRDVKLAFRQGAQKRSTPVYPDARGLCEIVREEGAELWLTTTRPYLRHDSIDPDTRFWLGVNDIPYDHLLYDEKKYSVLFDLVGRSRVAAVLDDLPEEYMAARHIFGENIAIQRITQYNQGALQGTAVGPLNQAAEEIVRRIHNWKEQNK